MIRSSGSKNKSTTKAIYDLGTSVKVLEHRAIGLEIIVDWKCWIGKGWLPSRCNNKQKKIPNYAWRR